MKAYQPIRLTLNNAAKEFAIDPKTLTKGLVQLGISATNGTYSISEIEAVKFGDMHGEKLGKLRAEREAAEIKAALAKGQAVLAEDADATLADYGTAVRSVIESARYLSEDQRAKLLSSVHAIEIDPTPAADGSSRKSTAKKS